MAKIKIPRAEITQPAVGGGRDLIGVAAGNAVGTGLQDLVTKFATYEIKKNKVEEDTRINLKVQDRTSLLNSELEEEVNNIINDPNFAFLPDNELEKKWQKIEARVQAQYKKDQKEDPNFAKYYFSNMNTVLTRNKSLYRREKAKYLGVKTQQIVEDAGPTIINELAKIPPGSAKDAALNHFVSYVIPNTEKLALRYQIKYDSKKEIKQIKLAALEQNLLSQNNFIRKDGSPDYAAALKYVNDENNIDALGLLFDDGEGDLRDDLAKVLFNKNNNQADQDQIAFKQENTKNLNEALEILQNPSKYKNGAQRLKEIENELTNPLNVEGRETLNKIYKTVEEIQGGKEKTLSGAFVVKGTAELIRNEELISRNQKYKLAGEEKALSINDRLNLEGASGLNKVGYTNLSYMIDNSEYADATKLLEEKSENFRATFLGPDEFLINDSIANREYEIKVDFLRQIMLDDLKAGISVNALFDPNNEKYIFRDANLLPLTATREDINRMEDESLGLNVMSAEQKAIYIKKIKDSDEDVSDIVTENDDENKQEVNKFLRENPETINEYLKHRPITDVPEDLQEIVKPFIKNPQVEETQDKIGEKIGTSSEDPNRPVFRQGDENVSELSTTFEYPQGSGKIINIPSIHNGKQYNQDELIKMLDAGTIKPTSTHNSYEEAEQAAEERSKSIRIMEEEVGEQTNKNNLENTQGSNSQPMQDITKQVAQVAETEGGLFEIPQLLGVEPPPENASEQEKMDYVLDLGMQYVGSLGPVKRIDKLIGPLTKIFNKAVGKSVKNPTAKKHALAYEIFRRKGKDIGAEVDNFEDLTAFIKNPNKTMDEFQVKDFIEFVDEGAEVTVKSDNPNKLVVTITKMIENPRSYSSPQKLKPKKTQITNPTLQKLIDKGYKLKESDIGIDVE